MTSTNDSGAALTSLVEGLHQLTQSGRHASGKTQSTDVRSFVHSKASCALKRVVQCPKK